MDKLYFVGFFYVLLSTALIALLVLGWWAFNRGLHTWEKLLGFAVVVGEAWLVGKYSDRSINFFILWMTGFPLVATVIVGWLFLAKKLQFRSARLGFVLVVGVTWSCFLFIREEGADSRLKIKRHWRWTPTAEEQFLAKSRTASTSGAIAEQTDKSSVASVSPGDWTGFRGTNRDGVIGGTAIATNWNVNPPVQIWKHAVGPAWSSLLLVGNRLFTQEQRGEKEAVVCYDASTGSELWVSADTARFEESVSGPGPRATPTFADGRLFTLGGTGILNCLEAATGKCLWKRDIKEASGARVLDKDSGGRARPGPGVGCRHPGRPDLQVNRESDRSRRRDDTGKAQAALYRAYLPECRATDEHCLNWAADAEVKIRTNADDTPEDEHDAIAAGVFNKLTTDTLAADLSAALVDFTAFLANFKSQRWVLVDRSWQSILEFQIHCAGSDIS